ncbi:MAG TPA: hypothetical protein VHC20_01375 [Candidatus Paceibacterota bacterium]|jgi:hypothetical protein|nr:hypothetical protein [Candidatus Paceibacterota bacterium]
MRKEGIADCKFDDDAWCITCLDYTQRKCGWNDLGGNTHGSSARQKIAAVSLGSDSLASSERLSVHYLTEPVIAKKMRSMKQIDRRISCAPMMDWTDAREFLL